MTRVNRRRVLRGLLNGTAVTVALPLLDCFLNGNGTALASGAPMPVRFGTWFWGLGLTPGCGISEKTGTDFEFGEDLKPLTPYKKHINYFSGFNVPTAGATNQPHTTGIHGILTGHLAASMTDYPGTTLDVLVSDQIGQTDRFQLLAMAATGIAQHSLSARGAGNVNTPSVSAADLYARVFGPEFIDPNQAEFKPDPRVMARKSVLSGVQDQATDFTKTLGAADKARMDEFFTSIRQLEQQVALQMEKPPPAEACRVPKSPEGLQITTAIENVGPNHKAMAEILTLALACNQTKVFNMVFSNGFSVLRRLGDPTTHHTLSHDEPVDQKLGYQPETAWFARRCMENLATFIEAFRNVREGDGTLLDHTVIMACSDVSFAKIHLIDNLPMMTIGGGGGRLRTGQHISGKGDPISRVGLTLQQVMGLPIAQWGAGSLKTEKPVGEILA